MKQIKSFFSYSSLDNEVNEWLKENKEFTVTDIKYQFYKDKHTALVIYEKGYTI
jgi:3-methyladenine DNA glycosylase AlkC